VLLLIKLVPLGLEQQYFLQATHKFVIYIFWKQQIRTIHQYKI